MKCPRCVQQIHRAAETCPHCGFHIDDADALYQNILPTEITALTDAAGIFRRNDRIKILNLIGKFERKLPDLHLVIYSNPHSQLTDIRLLSYWILEKRVPPQTNPIKCPILITIDPNSYAASISSGYQLDGILTENDAFECLARAHPHWLEGHFTTGLIKAIHHLETLLEKRSRQALKSHAQSRKPL